VDNNGRRQTTKLATRCTAHRRRHRSQLPAHRVDLWAAVPI